MPQTPAEVAFIRHNRRPPEPVTKGNFVVGNANVLNHWTTLGGLGASTPEQLAVQTDKLDPVLVSLELDPVVWRRSAHYSATTDARRSIAGDECGPFGHVVGPLVRRHTDKLVLGFRRQGRRPESFVSVITE